MSTLYKNILFSQEEYIEQLEFWTEKLSGDINPISFPYDRKKVCGECRSTGEIEISICSQLSAKLINLSRNTDLTLYVILVSAFTALLYRYTGSNCIMVGAPVLASARKNPYNHMVFLKNDINGHYTFKEALLHVKETVIEAYKHQDYPMDMVMSKVGIDAERMELLSGMGILLENIHSISDFAGDNFNLLVSFMRKDGSISGKLHYNAELLEKSTAEGFAARYIRVLENAVRDINVQIKSIEVLSKEEKDEIIWGFNRSACNYRQSSTVKSLFEEQVEKTPESKAVIAGSESLTYRELNEKANQLARYLISKGVEKGSIVGLMADPSVEMMTGILGILKSGAAYLPIDPGAPEERLKYIVKDSGAGFILTQSHHMSKPADAGAVALNLNDMCIYCGDSSNTDVSCKPEDIVYVIYTSGTTGMPKGVLLENYGIENYVNWFTGKADLTHRDKAVLVSSFSFDLGYTTLYSSILNGCELHMLSREQYSDPEFLLDYICKNGITYIKATPSLFSTIIGTEAFSSPEACKTLRLIVLGGEQINLADVGKFHAQYPKALIMNHYGPTEATIGSIAHPIDFERFEDYCKTPVIGKPISNTQVYILDRDLNPLPIGIPGEIYISGHGLARGYLNRPELSSERFIPNPYIESAYMYKTGDMGRFTPQGNIEFLGRIDHQVKIRGYRVEVAGIENILLKYQGVKEALVLAKDDLGGNKYLCAYLVAEEIAVSGLREFLLKHLPDYMIPSYFISLEKMPLTANGKIDRKALPEPDGNIDTGAEYVEPRNELEHSIALVWQEVLGAKRVGIHDDFFILGGDSIKAIQVSSRLQKHDIKLEIRDLLRHPTIAELSGLVKIGTKSIDQGIVTGQAGLTPIQRRFFEYRFIDSHHWNQAVMLFNQLGFDSNIIRKVFNKIAEKHDALRMTYKLNGDTVVQYNRGMEGEPFTLDEFDMRRIPDYVETINSEANGIQSGIDLESGPLVKLGLFKTDDGDHLLIAIHHLVVDGVSWRIIFDDFARGYMQSAENQEISLEKKTNSFKDWTHELEKYAKSETLLKELEYWRNIENTEVAALPKDMVLEGVSINRDSKVLSLDFSEHETEKLLRHVHRPFNTEINDILLTALGMSFKQWTGEDKALINLEGHGRENISDSVDISGTVGWFTSVHPVVLDMSHSDNISLQIRHVKETLRRVPNKGIGYGILKYMTPDALKEGIQFSLKPEICFNYLGQFDQDINTQVFQLSTLPHGNTVSPYSRRQYAFHINGMVQKGKLVLSFSYNCKEYHTHSVLKFMELYRNSLQNIISYCINREGTELGPSDLTYSKLSIEELDAMIDKYGNNSSRLQIQDVCSLTHMQEVMLCTTTYNKGITPYFHSRAFTIKGDIDISILEKGLNLITQKYDILRTVFDLDKPGQPLQVVFKSVDTNIHYEDISHMSLEDKLAYFNEYKIRDAERGFDLSSDNLMRLSILKTDAKEYKAVWSNHHLILDGWCRMIILKEFLQTVQMLKENKPVPQRKAIPYSTYIKWFENQDMEKAYSYWKDLLHGYTVKPLLKKVEPLHDEGRYTQKNVYRILDNKITTQLSDFAKKNQVTLNIVFQGIWAVLLQKLNGADDVVFGSAVSGRTSAIPDVESIVGPLINIIPVRVKNEENLSFAQCVKSLQQLAIESEKYCYFSLERYKGSKYGKDLIDSAIFFENYPIEDGIKKLYDGEGRVCDIEIFDQVHCNFNMFVIPFETTTVKLSYNELIYSEVLAESVAEYLVKIVHQIVGNPDILIADIAL